MKFKRIGIFSIISVVTVGGLMALYRNDQVAVDKKMEFVDYSGDRSALEGVAFKNTIKVGNNDYEKVTLLNNTVNFKETKYDELYRADEIVLNNKELFRGKYNPSFYGNEKKLMTIVFNQKFYLDRKPTVEIAIKDKDSNKVEKKVVTLPNIKSNSYVNQEEIMHVGGNLFYTITVEDYNTSKSTVYVYGIDMEKMTLQNVVEMKKHTTVSPIVSNGKQMYMVSLDDMKMTLAMIDPMKKTVVEKDMTSMKEKTKIDYISNVALSGNTLLVAGNGTDVYGINLDTYTLNEKQLFKPKFIEKQENMALNIMEMHVENEKLYVTYRDWNMGHDDTFIVAYSLKSGAIAYEGKLPTMKNRGTWEEYSMD